MQATKCNSFYSSALHLASTIKNKCSHIQEHVSLRILITF